MTQALLLDVDAELVVILILTNWNVKKISELPKNKSRSHLAAFLVAQYHLSIGVILVIVPRFVNSILAPRSLNPPKSFALNFSSEMDFRTASVAVSVGSFNWNVTRDTQPIASHTTR